MDAIRVRSADGGEITVGSTVLVDVSVWGGSEPGELRLFRAEDMPLPTWSEVGSATVAPGAQVVSFSFVMPLESLRDMQLVRAALRTPGVSEPCMPGAFHDHDDLAFMSRVAPSIFLESPAEGATLTGTVSLSAYVSDNDGLASVEFWLGQSLLREQPRHQGLGLRREWAADDRERDGDGEP